MVEATLSALPKRVSPAKGKRVAELGRERMEQQSERLTGMGRPGLVTFAAVMVFALGGFHVLLAISEFARSTWVLSRLDIELLIPILFI